MPLFRRLPVAAAPFVVVIALFALALRHHLGEPARRALAFDAARRAAVAGEGEGTGARTGEVGPTDFIALSRIGCRGGCPSYDVRIDASGRVLFDGRALACIAHPPPAHVDPAAARALLAAAAAAGLLREPDPGERVAADGAGASLVLRIGAALHRVSFADGPDAPALPAAVARAVDELAGDARWLPGPGARCAPAAAGPAV